MLFILQQTLAHYQSGLYLYCRYVYYINVCIVLCVFANDILNTCNCALSDAFTLWKNMNILF